MTSTRAGSKRETERSALAADVWKLLFDYFQRHRERIQDLLAELNLSFGDMRALMVFDAEHPRPMRALAEACACDASNATWMVDRLETRGLVKRHVLPTDRRVKAVMLTERGVRTKADLLARMSEPPAELRNLSVADLEVLRDVLAKL